MDFESLFLFSLIVTGGFLRFTRTARATLAIFIKAWIICEACRFLATKCILTATNLKDIRISLILENKLLKKETL